MRRHLRTDAMQIERRRNEGRGVWGHRTSTKQVRKGKKRAGKRELIAKDLAEFSQATAQLRPWRFPWPLPAPCARCEAAPLRERLLPGWKLEDTPRSSKI